MKTYLLRYWPMYLIMVIVFSVIAVTGSRSVTTIAENIPVERSITFVIDAGHGGEDGGASSCTGVLESQLNLQIARRLDDLLHFLGYQTVMIRRSDISVYTEGKTIAEKKISDLKERVRIVNETEGAFLISIHQNIFADSRYSGAQVFYNQEGDAENIAHLLQQAMVTSLNPGSNRQCKPADGIYLMQHSKRPGILVECGFISNPKEERKLREGEYQKHICCVIASTLTNAVNRTLDRI